MSPLVLFAFALAAAALCFAAWNAWQLKQARTMVASGQGAREDVLRALMAGEQPVAVLDARGRVSRANGAFCDLLGKPDALGIAFTDATHLDDLARERPLWAELLAGQSAGYTVQKRWLQPGGEVWTQTEVHKLDGSEEALCLVQQTGALKQAEAELLASRQVLEELYQAVAGHNLSFADRMRALLSLGCRRFGLETGVVGRVAGEKFEVMQCVTPDDSIRRGDVYNIAAGFGEPSTNGHSNGHNGHQNGGPPDEWHRHPFYSATDVEAYLGAPLYVNGRLYGTLNFGSKTGREAPFSDSDQQLLKLMAQWAGGEIERRQAKAELEAKQAELLEANKKLEALATHDGLTGVKNRRAFDDQLKTEFARSRRYGTPLSLMLLDVDKFKSYNDTFGHQGGDEVLKTVAQLLQISVRNIDFLARYGGEEFVLILPNTDSKGATLLADRLRQRIQEHAWPQREVTASFGVATLTEEMFEDGAPAITHAADRALYFSKDEGRNRVTHARDVPSALEAASHDDTL